MNLVDFHSLRNGLQANGIPADAEVCATLAPALRDALVATGAFTAVEVGGTDEINNLLVVLADYVPGITEEEVAGAVDQAWAAVAFSHWQASGLLTENGHVEVLAATLDRPAGQYVTLHLVARRADVPTGQEVRVGHTTLLPAQRKPRKGLAARIIARSA